MDTSFVLPLTGWYEKNHRTLPWRETKDPYRIWLSEIMLQQTRVEAVKAYYARFLATLPTIADLAAADEETILKLWEGLGYYSRVRNMQKAARYVMTHYFGALPADYNALLALPGIGAYTAGAIASFAFDLPYAAVDGNVLRVMSRIAGDMRDIALDTTKKAWKQYMETALLTRSNAAVLNQALMELGACVCLPNGAPKCDVCPAADYCIACKQQLQHTLPVKSGKKPRKIEHLHVFFILYENKIAIRKRGVQGLLASLWEFPNCSASIDPAQALSSLGIVPSAITPLSPQKHIFTHVEWHMDCFFVNVLQKNTDDSLVWVSPEELHAHYALPSAFRPMVQAAERHMEESGLVGSSI